MTPLRLPDRSLHSLRGRVACHAAGHLTAGFALDIAARASIRETQNGRIRGLKGISEIFTPTTPRPPADKEAIFHFAEPMAELVTQQAHPCTLDTPPEEFARMITAGAVALSNAESRALGWASGDYLTPIAAALRILRDCAFYHEWATLRLWERRKLASWEFLEEFAAVV